MTTGIDVGANVRVKDGAPSHAGEKGKVLRLGLDREATAWMVQFQRGEAEIRESDLELVAESRL